MNDRLREIAKLDSAFETMQPILQAALASCHRIKVLDAEDKPDDYPSIDRMVELGQLVSWGSLLRPGSLHLLVGLTMAILDLESGNHDQKDKKEIQRFRA